MKRTLCAFLAASFLLLAGCGGDRDKGQNRHKDLPREAPKETTK